MPYIGPHYTHAHTHTRAQIDIDSADLSINVAMTVNDRLQLIDEVIEVSIRMQEFDAVEDTVTGI